MDSASARVRGSTRKRARSPSPESSGTGSGPEALLLTLERRAAARALGTQPGPVRVVSTTDEAREMAVSGDVRWLIVDRSVHLQQRLQLLRMVDASTAHVVFLGAMAGRQPAATAVDVLRRLLREAGEGGAFGAVTGPRPLSRIPVRRADEIALLPAVQIASLEADGEQVHLTTVRGERHTVSRPLKSLEARLDPGVFVRLSRGVVVNVNAISRLRVLARGGLAALMATGAEFPISRSQAPAIRSLLVGL